MSHDYICRAVAKFFLESRNIDRGNFCNPSEKEIESLANHIQLSIEDWLAQDTRGIEHSEIWPCEHCAALDPNYLKKGPPQGKAAKA